MTQDCSLLSSTADVNDVYNNKRLPKGIHIVGTGESVSKVGEIAGFEDVASAEKPEKENVVRSEDECADDKIEIPSTPKTEAAPWGYIFIQHMSAAVFEKNLENRNLLGDFKPKCFVHRTVRYKDKPDGKGVVKTERPTVNGLVFLQGATNQLRTFLKLNFPQYYLVNNCSTKKPASIPDSVMQPFMAVMQNEPERLTFMREPFERFAKDHVRLRVPTGLFKGQEGYVVRVKRDRQLVMNIGGFAVAVNNVHNEDFEIAE